MGVKQDVEDALRDFEFTKIEGQPTDEDLNKLSKELTNALASIPTTLGGGKHGHIGMIIDETEYVQISHGGAKFDAPTNPGVYPATVDENNAAIREKQVAEHKAMIEVFHTHEAVAAHVRKVIVKVVDPEWLGEIESETLGFTHRSPKEMLTHLRNNGADLDHLDVTQLTVELQKEWDMVEAPVTYFTRGDRYERQLEKAGQTKNPTLRLAFALATFERSGEYENSLRDWDAKGASVKTFANFRTFIQSEFSKKVKHNKTSAKSVGHGIANTDTDAEVDKVDVAEAAAIAIAEVAQVMQAQQNEQFKQMMNMFKTMMADKKDSPAPTNQPASNTSDNRQGRGGKCPHCGGYKHNPKKCWELEENAAKRPENWTSQKKS